MTLRFGQSRWGKPLTLLILVAILLSTLPSAALAIPPSANAEAAMWQQGTPPVLLNSTPATGANWDGGPVTLTFDQALAAVDNANLQIEPTLAGDVTATGATLTFTPATPPAPGTRYRLILTDITSAEGITQRNPVEITLAAASPLQVTSTQPRKGATDVAINSQIVVVFNRPVVPLTGGAEAADLPQPLTIEPAVEGQGEWLNTSVYVFRPTLGLAGSTSYQVTVDQISGLSGETLAEPYTFAFTTAEPLVNDVQFSFNVSNQVRPDSTVQVLFSQPMDTASTSAAFRLIETFDATATPVAGEITWNAAQTTLTFSPTQPLIFGRDYTVQVETRAQPASRQGNLREPFTRSFQVVPLPAITVVSPLDGAEGVSPEENVTIRFSAPLSETTVLRNVRVSPVLTTSQVYSYYSPYDNLVTLSWFKEAHTQYTVTVGSEITDEYGNPLGKEQSFRFTTGDYPPFTRINLDQFNHFSAYTQTQVSLYYRNVEQVTVELFQVPPNEFIKLTGPQSYDIWNTYQVPDQAENRVWQRTYATRVGRNITAEQVVTLTTPSGDLLAPGIYLLEVQQPQLAQEVDPTINRGRVLIILSNYNLVVKKSIQGPSLAWLTDLRTGEPLAGADVRFYQDQSVLGEATTDARGIATATLALTPNNFYQPVQAMSGETGTETFAAVLSEWNNGIAVWDFNLNGGFNTDQYQMYFYTDRPIYRPGQTVYWKGLVRGLVDEQYTLPPASLPISITVRDGQGNAILEREYNFGELGTVNDKIELASTAPSGFYYLEAKIILSPERVVYGGAGFQVGNYEKPEFQISVTSDQPEYIQGDEIRFRVQADYFSGGALGNAPVSWRLFAEPYSFNGPQGPSDRYYSFDPYNPAQDGVNNLDSGFFGGLLQEGTGVTAADGSFVIDLPADLHDALQSQNWAFDVTVQSTTNQFVSGRVTVPVHKGNFYIGLSPRSYVVNTGEESTVDLLTITPQGEPYPAAELAVLIYEYKWNSVYEQAADGSYRWATSVERTPVFTTTATTDRQGAATITWTPNKGGQYQIIARGQDDAGNPISSAAYLYVSQRQDTGFVAWPRANNDRIKLVADKQLYQPGETATVLIPSPFSGPVQALVTIERNSVIEAKTITLQGNSETLQIPVTAAYIPNIFVSVVIVKGVDESNPFPALRVGYVQLTVDTAEKALTLIAEATATEVKPGDTVSYTLTVQDSAGTPVPNAEVSVALVDKAILTLAAGDNRKLIDVFYYQRGLGVTSGYLLSINRDRLSQQLSEGAKGGGGGDGGGGIVIREDFPDIAFWRANFVTDVDGRITFSVTLPDNLTTWTLAAKAITADTLVGETTSEIVATKALQVRPLLPRFFTAGDRAKIGAVMVNASENEISDLQFTIDAAGANIDTDATEISTSLKAGEQKRFDFPITVDPTSSSAVFTFTAQSPITNPQSLSDAVRIELPIRRYETPEVVATSGVVPPEGVVEAVRVPETAGENGELAVTLEPSLAAGMVTGLDYLEHFPYECNEQTVSRFLPNLMTVGALRKLDIANPELEADLAYQLGIGVQRLVNRQNADGGWGYWPGEDSSPFISAYVVWGLVNAVNLDYSVPERALDNALNYLERQFQAPKDITENWRLNELAFLHFVLAEAGQGDPGRASTLYDVRERLDYYGQALLAMALAEMAKAENTTDERVDTLLDNLFGAASLSATGASWHETAIDWQTLNTDIRTTSIVLAAFTRLDPDQPMLAQVVRWLMSARNAGRWSTTQENAWAIIALTDWMDARPEGTRELRGAYEWTALLNSNEIGKGVVGPENISQPFVLQTQVADLLREQANLLQINRSNNNGQLYYSAHLRYYLDALAVDARDRGLVVDRRFALADKTVNSAQVGDVVSVTLTLVAPTDLYHVLIEAPIPAGTEAVDTSLATTSIQYASPELQQADSPAPPWGFWSPTYSDIRDDQVALFATYLPAGAYTYTFQVRATVPGEYRVLPVYGELMYFPEVWGRSAGALFTVTE